MIEEEQIHLPSLSDRELVARIRALEQKYGCSYRPFVARGDFDDRPDEEWMDELLWRVLEDELSDRLDRGLQRVKFPIPVQVEA